MGQDRTAPPCRTPHQLPPPHHHAPAQLPHYPSTHPHICPHCHAQPHTPPPTTPHYHTPASPLHTPTHTLPLPTYTQASSYSHTHCTHTHHTFLHTRTHAYTHLLPLRPPLPCPGRGSTRPGGALPCHSTTLARGWRGSPSRIRLAVLSVHAWLQHAHAERAPRHATFRIWYAGLRTPVLAGAWRTPFVTQVCGAASNIFRILGKTPLGSPYWVTLPSCDRDEGAAATLFHHRHNAGDINITPV